MTHLYLRAFLTTAVAVAGFLVASPAAAGHSKTISLRLHNQTSDTPMTCTVYRVVRNTDGVDVDTRLRRFAVRPKNKRPAAQQNTPQNFTLRVEDVGRRYDRTPIFPRLRMTCELATQNTLQRSPLWDPSSQSYENYRFKGSCRSGAYCSLGVERR